MRIYKEFCFVPSGIDIGLGIITTFWDFPYDVTSAQDAAALYRYIQMHIEFEVIF